MRYLFDTDTCIHLIRRKSPGLLKRLQDHPAEDVGLSSISVAELRFGASKSQDPQRNHEALDLFLAPFALVAFDLRAAAVYGGIRAHLERAGTLIGPLDMLIAAHALGLGVPLVTHNLREFVRVPGLLCETWV